MPRELPASSPTKAGEEAQGGAVSRPTKDYARRLYEQAMARQEAQQKLLAAAPCIVRVTRQQLAWLLVLAAAGGGILGYNLRPPAASVVPWAAAPQVFIDLATGKTVQAAPGEEADPVSAMLSEGKVVPAAWCDTCRKWYAVPAAEQLEKLPLGRPFCPRHPGTPLSPSP